MEGLYAYCSGSLDIQNHTSSVVNSSVIEIWEWLGLVCHQRAQACISGTSLKLPKHSINKMNCCQLTCIRELRASRRP